MQKSLSRSFLSEPCVMTTIARLNVNDDAKETKYSEARIPTSLKICGATCAQSLPWFCSSTEMMFCMKIEGMEDTAAVNTMHKSTSGNATG